ncbi:hypothetical protein Tco_0637681 [Tanacetum coccineum]
MTNLGCLPLLNCLRFLGTRVQVICSVLQVLIIKIIKLTLIPGKCLFLLALVPVVMGFAVPDRTREVRMEAVGSISS